MLQTHICLIIFESLTDAHWTRRCLRSYFPKGCIKTCLKLNECLILEMLIHLLIWTLMFTNTVKRVLCLSMTMTSDVNNLQLCFHTKAPLTKTSADNGWYIVRERQRGAVHHPSTPSKPPDPFPRIWRQVERGAPLATIGQLRWGWMVDWGCCAVF